MGGARRDHGRHHGRSQSRGTSPATWTSGRSPTAARPAQPDSSTARQPAITKLRALSGPRRQGRDRSCCQNRHRPVPVWQPGIEPRVSAPLGVSMILLMDAEDILRPILERDSSDDLDLWRLLCGRRKVGRFDPKLHTVRGLGLSFGPSMRCKAPTRANAFPERAEPS